MRTPIWTIKELSDETKKRIENRNDSIILISGRTGSGKSNMAVKFFNHFKDFKLKDCLTYDRAELINKIQNLKNSYIFADELIKNLNRRKFYDTEQIELIQNLAMYRSSQNIFVGCVPIFWSLDSALLQLVSCHIHIIKRGVGAVFFPLEGRLFHSDIWYVRQSQKLEDDFDKIQKKKPSAKINWSKYPTFAGFVFFKALTSKQEKYYEKLKDEKRRLLNNPIDEKTKGNFYERILKVVKEGNLSESELLKICIYEDRKLSSVRIRINQILKDSGDIKTLKDYLKSEDKSSMTSSPISNIGELNLT